MLEIQYYNGLVSTNLIKMTQYIEYKLNNVMYEGGIWCKTLLHFLTWSRGRLTHKRQVKDARSLHNEVECKKRNCIIILYCSPAATMKNCASHLFTLNFEARTHSYNFYFHLSFLKRAFKK